MCVLVSEGVIPLAQLDPATPISLWRSGHYDRRGERSGRDLLERRVNLSRLMRVEILCVEPEVVGHKRGNEVVAVIIAMLHPNVDRVVRGVTGRRDQWRLELFV